VDAVRAILAGPSQAFVVLEGGTLLARSKLRTALEAADAGAAIGCYPLEGRDLARVAQELAAERGLTIDADVVQWLSEGESDFGQLRQNIERLSLFRGLEGSIDLDAAQECLSGAANPSLDDALFAATEGDVAACDGALALALEGSQAAVPTMRAAIVHIQRLLRARQAVDAGLSEEQALSRLRPPLFWRRQRSFARALRLWQAPTLARLLTALQEQERCCKQTGTPAGTVCAQTLLDIAAGAASHQVGGQVSHL
jgi:DNA polymerase-3 subunit delta